MPISLRTVPEPVHAAPAPAPTAAAAWVAAWAQPTFRWLLGLILVIIFGGLVPIMAPFFHYIQQRTGHHLPDPLLAHVPAYDVAVPIFVLMYGCTVAGVGFLLARPKLLLQGLWAYALLLLFRIITIWLWPLEPPVGILGLPDPFTEHLFRVTTAPITKDLFFSGHTATVTLLALAVRGRWWRTIIGLAATAVGVLVLVQHVHYSYDVVAAPFFAWLAYWLGGRVYNGDRK